MFAFSQVEPRTNGEVTDMEVPMGRYMGAAMEQGQDDSIFHNIYKMREMSLAESDPNAKLLSPEEANNRYAIPGLKWDAPVKENVAQLLNKRQQANNDRAFFLSQDNHGILAGMAGMGAQMTGSMMNPLDLGLLFVPVVGEGDKLAEGASALGKGLISRAALKEAFPKFPRLAESMIQGMSYQALAEGVNIAQRQLAGQGGANIEDLKALGYGALFTAGLHMGIAGALKGFSHLTPEAKTAAAQKAMDDFAKGKRIDVSDVVRQDIPLPDPSAHAPVVVPPEVDAFAKEIGFDISRTSQLGGMRLDGLSPEEIQNLQGVMGHQSDWEFTDRRPDSPTSGFTFYAPEGTPIDQLRELSLAKIDAYNASKAARAPIDENTLVQQELLDKIKASGARTRREIQELFPDMHLKNQEAAELRKRAWNERAQQTVNAARETSATDLSKDQKAENAALQSAGKTLSPEEIQGSKLDPAKPDIEKIKREAEAKIEALKAAAAPKPSGRISEPPADKYSPAIRLSDGTIVKGAPGQGHVELKRANPGKSDSGWVTPEGEFLNTLEVARREMKQQSVANIADVLSNAIKSKGETAAPEPAKTGPQRDPKTGRFMKAGAAAPEKLTDEPGLKLFHGTSVDFNKFGKGPAFFTSDPAAAIAYATEYSQQIRNTDVPGGTQQVIIAGVNIKNPLDLNTFEGASAYATVLREAGVPIKTNEVMYQGKKYLHITGDATTQGVPKGMEKYEQILQSDNQFDFAYIPEVQDVMKKHGYDALSGNDLLEQGEIPAHVLMEPETNAKVLSKESMEHIPSDLEAADEAIRIAADCLLKKII